MTRWTVHLTIMLIATLSVEFANSKKERHYPAHIKHFENTNFHHIGQAKRKEIIKESTYMNYYQLHYNFLINNSIQFPKNLLRLRENLRGTKSYLLEALLYPQRSSTLNGESNFLKTLVYSLSDYARNNETRDIFPIVQGVLPYKDVYLISTILQITLRKPSCRYIVNTKTQEENNALRCTANLRMLFRTLLTLEKLVNFFYTYAEDCNMDALLGIRIAIGTVLIAFTL